MANREQGLDAYGHGYSLWQKDALREDERRVGCVARIATLDGVVRPSVDGATQIGLFLLSAAGIDLVSAARKVVEADKTATVYQSGAIQALAAELAKLDRVSQ